MGTVSVRERVERAVAARLGGIIADEQIATDANGGTPYTFATTLTTVRRRGFPRERGDRYQIWQQSGETSYRPRDANGLLDEILRMVLIYSVPGDTKSPATDLNAARGDIRAALQTNGSQYIPYPLVFGSTLTEEPEILIGIVGDDIDFTEEIKPPLLLGMYALDVRYSTVTGNPAMWCPDDVMLVE